MMKLIQSLLTYLFPLSCPAPAPLHALLAGFGHYWNWARMGLPLGPSHRAALGWEQSNFCRKTGASKTTPSRCVNGTTPMLAWKPDYLEAVRKIKRLHQVYIDPAA